jgi:mRNA-degrading endonuclease RelE of RelBE toxin-antitoxin system
LSMAYVLTMTKPAHRMFKRLSPDTRSYLVDEAGRLLDNPGLGEQLRGKLSFLRSYHVVYKRTHYRIVYEVSDRLKEVIVRGVGPRENLYQKVKRMKLKPLIKLRKE